MENTPSLLDILKSFRKLLGPDGDYSICRSDKKNMTLGEAICIGDLFEKADAAIAKAEGADNGTDRSS